MGDPGISEGNNRANTVNVCITDLPIAYSQSMSQSILYKTVFPNARPTIITNLLMYD